jgi:hypothetical protein
VGRLGGDPRQRGVRLGRGGGTAEHDRVARLQAQRRRVDRDVRAGLVDHRDDAERHPDLAHVQPVWQAVPVDHLADRIRQGDDLADGRRDRLHAPLVEPQTVEQRGADVGFAPALHVLLVGGEDLGDAVFERGRDREQRGVLDARRCNGELTRRPLGARAPLPHGLDRSRHSPKE